MNLFPRALKKLEKSVLCVLADHIADIVTASFSIIFGSGLVVFT